MNRDEFCHDGICAFLRLTVPFIIYVISKDFIGICWHSILCAIFVQYYQMVDEIHCGKSIFGFPRQELGKERLTYRIDFCEKTTHCSGVRTCVLSTIHSSGFRLHVYHVELINGGRLLLTHSCFLCWCLWWNMSSISSLLVRLMFV